MRTKLLQLVETRRKQQLLRQLTPRDARPGPEVQLEGIAAISFCSNDYLGLAADPRVIAASQAAIQRYGVGSGSAPTLTGYCQAHHALETALAGFLERPAVRLFASGYAANLGVLSCVADRHTQIYLDRDCHASIIDGARLSRAHLTRFPHNDIAALAQLLSGATAQAKTSHEKLIVTEGLYGMTGDVAPLSTLAQMAQKKDAWLYCDDAHGIGVIGHQGRGLAHHLGLSTRDVPILIGTLGKALGSQGAFIAGEETVIAAITQNSRPYLFSTAPAPTLAAAATAALHILTTDPMPLTHLLDNIKYFRSSALAAGLPIQEQTKTCPLHPIQIFNLGNEARAQAASEGLISHGCWVKAIRYPTVPRGQARLRITLTARHTQAHLDKLIAGLKHVI